MIGLPDQVAIKVHVAITTGVVESRSCHFSIMKISVMRVAFLIVDLRLLVKTPMMVIMEYCQRENN